jgi:hypothetical protein
MYPLIMRCDAHKSSIDYPVAPTWHHEIVGNGGGASLELSRLCKIPCKQRKKQGIADVFANLTPISAKIPASIQ